MKKTQVAVAVEKWLASPASIKRAQAFKHAIKMGKRTAFRICCAEFGVVLPNDRDVLTTKEQATIIAHVRHASHFLGFGKLLRTMVTVDGDERVMSNTYEYTLYLEWAKGVNGGKLPETGSNRGRAGKGKARKVSPLVTINVLGARLVGAASDVAALVKHGDALDQDVADRVKTALDALTREVKLAAKNVTDNMANAAKAAAKLNVKTPSAVVDLTKAMQKKAA